MNKNEWLWRFYLDNYRCYIDHNGKPKKSAPQAVWVAILDMFDFSPLQTLRRQVEE